MDALPPERLADGTLAVTALVARPGIYLYEDADFPGGFRRELITPEVLFDPKSLATLGAVTLTLGHPADAVNQTNFSAHAVGHVDSTVDVVPDPKGVEYGYVRIRTFLKRDDAIKAMLDGSAREFSPGYNSDIVIDPGVDPRWGAYDSYQLTRTYNHLAQCSRARGGSALRAQLMDSLDPAHRTTVGIQVMEASMPGITIRHDSGHTLEFASQRDADAFSAILATAKKDMEDVVGEKAAEVVAAKGRIVAIEEELAALKKKLEELTGASEVMKADAAKEKARADAAEAKLADPVVLDGILRPRLDAQGLAVKLKIPGADKWDAKVTLADMQKAIVKTLQPALASRVDGYTTDTLAGAYEVAIAGVAKQTTGDGQPVHRVDGAGQTTGGGDLQEVQRKQRSDSYIPPKY